MGMGEVIDKITDMISSEIPKAENEYIGENMLLHCSKCLEPVQKVIKILGSDRKVRCICSCRRKELEEQQAREKEQELSRMRSVCFAETNMHDWSFENDDQKNPDISKGMLNYAEQFDDLRKSGKGLLLYGPVGTGKTYYAACIANKLINNGYDVLMTNFARISNELSKSFEGRQAFIDSLNRYSLLVIDDLGAERKSEYMQEIVFNIIDSRYRSGKPFIITTNLTADEIKKPQEMAYSRIYDRILERCFPVKVDGSSRRRQELKNSFQEIKERLGL